MQTQEPFIKINNLLKTYTTPEKTVCTVLNIEQLTFKKGEQYGIKGMSGSGKTTLLNIIAGILSPDKGSITIDNTELTALTESKKDRFRAENIGYIFQNFNLLKGFTALENILLAMQFASNKQDKEKTALELLKQVGLENKTNYKPQQLSYGQQQRVAIARALANKPQLLLADEPTGSLDKNTTTEIIDLINTLTLKHNITLLMATHDLDIVANMNNIIEL